MDSEFKKLLAGASWADTGDRIDMDDTSIQPTIDRSEGYPIDFSTDTSPTRARINQILRELTGAAKEVVRGVSAYDAEVDYPQGSICQANGDLYYAVVAHSAASPVNPLTLGQTAWALIAGRSAAERTVPAEVPSANIFIDGDRADRFQVWWYPPDDGGHPITQSQVRWAKDINFAGGTQTTGSPGFERTIATHDSDLFYVSVRSRNQLGWSPWSSAKRVRSSPVSPGPVNFTRVIASGSAGIANVFWVRPEDNGLDISQFRIQWALETGQDFSTTERNRLISVTDQTTLNYSTTITGLSSTQGIKFRVQAISNRSTTSAGGNEPSALLIGTNDVPSKPSILSEAVSATRARAWIDQFGFTDGGHTIQYYEWSWRVRGTSTWNMENILNPTYIVKHDRGQLVDVRVRAYNGAGGGTGFSAYSDIHQVSAFNPSLPEPPVISVESSTTVVADALKGVVNFSMGNMTRPEITKDRIRQVAVRWAPTGGSSWTELSGTDYPNLTDNNFSVRQIFPATGNLALDTQLDVQARWRNSRGWSNWSSSVQLGAVSAPSGNLVLSSTNIVIPEGSTSTLNVRLSREPIENTTVTITSSNSDLTVSPSTLTFTDANWGVDQAVTLTAATDTDEINDAAILTLRTTGGLSISDDTVGITIQEPVRIIAGFSSGTIWMPEDGSVSMPVGLSTNPVSNVVITPAITGSPDITISPSSLTFTPTNGQAQQLFTVRAATDADSVNDQATITFTATGAVSDSFTRTVRVTDIAAPVLIRESPALTTIGVGLSRTFSADATTGIRLDSAPAAGFNLALKPVNSNQLTVSPASMTFDRTNWNIRQGFTISVPSTATPNSSEYILLEPQNANDIQADLIRVNITDTLTERTNASAYIIPEGNYIERRGVRLDGSWASGNDITITPSSTNPDLSFTPTSRVISTSNSLSLFDGVQFQISAATDADVVNENIPVVYTATGGLTGSLSVPTMVIEPSNALQFSATSHSNIGLRGSYNNGVFTTQHGTNGSNNVWSATFGVRLLNEPLADVVVTTDLVRIETSLDFSGSGAFYTPHNITGLGSTTFTPSNYDTIQTTYISWYRTASIDSGDEVIVFDFRATSTDTGVSIPIQRIRFVAP